MPSAFIDNNGNIVQQRGDLESNQMEGREMLLRSDVQPQALRQENPDLDRDSNGGNGGFRFFGFPDFKWQSVIGVIVALQLVMYVVSLWLVTPRGTISPTGVALYKIGSSNSGVEMCAIRDNFPSHLIELRRWLVPIFLHASPFHIMMNLYFECSAGPRIEARDSSLAFAILFFGAGLLGNLLSDTFGVNGVGGSTSCYGIIGMDVAIWYQKWPELSPEERESVKSGLLQTCGMLLLWEVIFWKEIDHFGHLGGFIGGFFILLGRTNRLCAAMFCAIVAICVWIICVQPLFSDTYNGQPWQVTCNSAWASYR